MKLQVEIMGQGPDMVLLHGWGMNACVWQPVQAALARHYRLHLVDLPGFGLSQGELPQEYGLDYLVACLLPYLPERSYLLGWSLGGLVATQLALVHPERVEALITVASSPRFVAQGDWPGIKPEVLDGFMSLLEQDAGKTVERFLAIQAMGSEHVKDEVRRLKTLLASRPLPDPKALAGGLRLLHDCDLRQALPRLQVPLLRLYGRLDALVPRAVIPQVSALAPTSQEAVLPKAAHAPFLSHPEEFVTCLQAALG